MISAERIAKRLRGLESVGVGRDGEETVEIEDAAVAARVVERALARLAT